MNFSSLEWLYATGRGWIALVDFQGDEHLYDPACLLNESVYIDGWEFEVNGIERFLRLTSPKTPYKGMIGLLVK